MAETFKRKSEAYSLQQMVDRSGSVGQGMVKLQTLSCVQDEADGWYYVRRLYVDRILKPRKSAPERFHENG